MDPFPPARYRRDFDTYLRAFLDRGDGDLYAMARYHMGWQDAQGRPTDLGGKALRPLLGLLASESVGGDWRRALPAAAAVELVHSFSLIHDDIQDRDEERRHRPTVWKVWGEAQAINAGDALLALARLSLLRLNDEGVAPGVVLEAARVLDERTLEMVEGQVLDIAFEETPEVGVDACVEMIEKKTGALFDASLHLGALAGGAEMRLAGRMGRCGRLLGVAFQVCDDVLGVWGDPGRTGKAPGADIRRRKKTLPVVHLFGVADAATLDRVRQVYAAGRVSEDDAAFVRRALDSSGAQGFCRELAGEYLRKAEEVLRGLGLDGRYEREFGETARFLLERDA